MLGQTVRRLFAIMLRDTLMQNAVAHRPAEFGHFIKHGRIRLPDPYEVALKLRDPPLQSLPTRLALPPEPREMPDLFWRLVAGRRFRPILQQAEEVRLPGRNRRGQRGTDQQNCNGCHYAVLRASYAALANAPHPSGRQNQQCQNCQSQPQSKGQIGQNAHISSPYHPYSARFVFMLFRSHRAI
ncbi:hypothetical protein [Ferrovibrio sp.]|uniref:hypothetical protein n=1 Tax=Ferrovibrio sp. TaxID=1917215 RepID=UPI0035B20099